MPIPPLNPATGYLPPGEHRATWSELVDAYGGSYGRKQLLGSLEIVLRKLRCLGVIRVWIDGSFVTSKPRPGDVDVVYEATQGADPRDWGELAPGQRAHVKKRYKIDLWPYPSPQPVSGQPFKKQTIVQFFSRDEDDLEKGIVLLEGEIP